MKVWLTIILAGLSILKEWSPLIVAYLRRRWDKVEIQKRKIEKAREKAMEDAKLVVTREADKASRRAQKQAATIESLFKRRELRNKSSQSSQ